MELFKASNQWKNRPRDERFMTVEEMLAATRGYYDNAREAEVSYDDLRVQAVGDELLLQGKENIPARLSNWSYKQLVYRAVPKDSGRVAKYLATLPATLAAQNINIGLKRRAAVITKKERKAQLLIHNGGPDFLLRAITSDVYTRFWNWELIERLQGLQELGWMVPPAMAYDRDDPRNRVATTADIAPFNGTTTVRVGDTIGPAGLYASAHDMFAFMVRPDRSIQVGPDRHLSRGAFFWNSEVGGGSLGFMRFLYIYSCANHIVWGAEDVTELRIAHVGDKSRVSEFFDGVEITLTEYANESTSDLEAKIESAKIMKINGAFKKEQVLDFLFGRVDVSKRQLGKAYDLCEKHEDGDPRTYWGMTQGLTRLSQNSDYTDARVHADRAAGKVLKMAF